MDPVSLAAWSTAFFLSASLFSHTVALRLVLLAFGTLCCALALVRSSPGLRALPAIWIPFLLWAAWAVASLLWTVEPDRTVKELRNEVMYAGLALWTCHIGAQARDATRIVLPVLAAAVVVLCALGLYHFAQGSEHYVAGRHGGPGNLSSAALVVFPCAIMSAWYGLHAGWRRVFVWSPVFVAMILGAAYTTLNRTVWIGFAAQILIMAAMLLAARRRWLVVAAAALLAASSAMTLRLQAERGGIELTEDPRLTLWPEVMDHVEERPLTGYGFGRGLLRRTLEEEFRNGLLWHAHNLFLDTVLQTGVIGLVLLFALLAAILHQGWRMTRAGDALGVACGVALIAVLAGVVIRNMTDTLLVRHNALFFWGVVGVLLAWGRMRAPVA